MPDPARSSRLRPFAIVTAVLATALTGMGGIAALLGGWLAQLGWAFGLRAAAPAGAGDWKRDVRGLALLWGLAIAASAVLIAWPLSALLRHRGLGAALALSAGLGVGLIALWRLWPLWRALEHEGGALRTLWRALPGMQTGVWRGLGVAAAILAIAASVAVLAWPGLLPETARWGLAAAMLLLWPALHWVILRARAPAQALQPVASVVFDDETDTQIETDLALTPLPAQQPEQQIDVAELYAAARGGRVAHALRLLEAGADAFALPPPGDRDQRHLPVLAAVLPDLRLLRALIARGVDVNAAYAGLSPLQAATRDSWHGRPDAVTTLLTNGADPRAADADGYTPLHHAARSTDPGVAALLLDAAADVHAIANDGLTALGVACAAGNWRLAKFLLERGAQPEYDNGTPALLPAAGGDEDDPAGVQLLLKHKARIDARDARGRSALHEAALAGNVQIAQWLLDAGADVRAVDQAGRMPLLDAARGGHAPVLEVLLAANAPLDSRDGEGRNALALAVLAERPNAALVRRLLALGLDPATSSGGADAPLAEQAALAGRWSLVALLEPGGASRADAIAPESPSPAPPDRLPVELVREALWEEQQADLQPALLRLLTPTDWNALLRDADLQLRPDAIARLLRHGADPHASAPGEDGVLFAMLDRPALLPSLQVLLDAGVSPSGRGGLARFLAAQLACDGGRRAPETVALALLERGADAFARSATGEPALLLAARLGWMQVLERLLAQGSDPNATNRQGMSALHIAAALGRLPAVRMLLRHGASAALRASDGQTPLGIALAAGNRELADWLDWRGWPLPNRPLRASDLPAAAIVGDADAVRRLLALGFAVDAVDAQGCSALLRAAGGGHRQAVELLLEHGASPQQAAHAGATPLSAAVSMRQLDIVERLLASGANLEQRLPGNVTVLMLAAALGLPDVCMRLLTAGADIHAGDDQGLTPLHCAAIYGFTARERPRLMALLDTLLLAGARADTPAAGNLTPLLLLLGARAEPGTPCDEDVLLAGLEPLLDEGASLEARDPRGFGPLHLAALHGLLRVTQRLLRAGADPNARDSLNRTPREIAVMRGFVDVAAEFAPPPPGTVSMARFLRSDQPPG